MGHFLNKFSNFAREFWRHSFKQYLPIEVQDGGHVFCTVSDFEGCLGKFVFENVGNKSENDWVKLVALIQGVSMNH